MAKRKSNKSAKGRTPGVKLFPKIKRNDKWYCRVCGNPLGGRNENFCSPACKFHFAVCCWQGSARAAVGKRDKGVCAKCKLDTEKLKESLYERSGAWSRKTGKSWRIFYDRFISIYGFKTGHESFWEADHIISVKKGGAKLGLKNLQTLCIRCHKAKTFGS